MPNLPGVLHQFTHLNLDTPRPLTNMAYVVAEFLSAIFALTALLSR